MSEKGELPPDNLSLPPNYAPSETYTDSPPPVSVLKRFYLLLIV